MSGPPDPGRRGTGVAALAAAGAAVAFGIVSYTPNHYWDEYFYVYSVWQHGVSDLVAMEGALADGLFPNGFFSGKLAFVAFLDVLVSLSGPGEGGLLLLRGIFSLLVLALGGAIWLFARELVGPPGAWKIALIALFLPVPLYLGFKVLSEGPSLLLATLGSWQLLRGVRAAGPRRAAHLGLSGAAFGLAVVTRVTSILVLAGLVAALAVWRPGDVPLRRLIRDAAAVVALQAAIVAAVGLAFVGWPGERLAGLAASVTSRRPDPLVVGYGLALTVQCYAFVAAFALRPPLDGPTRAALAWLAVAVGPYLLTSQYLEPRYFYPTTVPLAVVAVSGLDRLAAALGRSRRGLAWFGAAGLVVALNRLVWAPLMPYELRETDYAALVQRMRAERPAAAYVTPWLTDFCYLSFAFPSERVTLAMSETYGTGRVFAAPEFRRWMGPHAYVGDAAALATLPRPWLYVGWEYNPAVQAIDDRLRLVGMSYLDAAERRARLLNHLTPSWIWSADSLRLEPVATSGAYRAFEIVPRATR